MSFGRLCVFCGSRHGVRPDYLASAAQLGAAIARRGWGLVYGGAAVGLMGAMADAALAAGGEVIGVIPAGLAGREIAHRRLTELRVVGSMHERKATMEALADGFVAMPGGVGTLEELLEIVTWAQLGIHRKPIGVLNVAGYYDALHALIGHAVAEGFVPAAHANVLLSKSEPEALLDAMAAWTPSVLGPKWLDRSQT